MITLRRNPVLFLALNGSIPLSERIFFNNLKILFVRFPFIWHSFISTILSYLPLTCKPKAFKFSSSFYFTFNGMFVVENRVH